MGKTIFLSSTNGKVVVPEGTIILDEQYARLAKYAGVVAEKNGTLPHIAFFSEKPISALGESEEDEIYARCAAVCPKIVEILAAQIEAEYDENGRVTNGEAWNRAPRLGIFGIPEVKDEDSLFHGFGLIREEV